MIGFQFPNLALNPKYAKAPDLDFESYLGKQYPSYANMSPDNKKAFYMIYNAILEENGETFTIQVKGKERKVNTSQGIKAFMRNLAVFLYNLDGKKIDMVEFHALLMKQINR